MKDRERFKCLTAAFVGSRLGRISREHVRGHAIISLSRTGLFLPAIEEGEKMGKELKPLSFDEFASNVRAIFDNMARKGGPVLIEREGQIYRLEPEQTRQPEALWTSYDPEVVRHGLRKCAGALAGVDRETLLRDVHQAREQVSHGRPS